MSVFPTLTEFSIALAGFSGIVIAIAAGDGPVAPLTWFRNLCALVSVALYLPAGLATLPA